MHHVSPINLHLSRWDWLEDVVEVEELDAGLLLRGPLLQADFDPLSALGALEEISCTNAISFANYTH